MKTKITLVVILALLFYSCHQNRNESSKISTKHSLSREERVKEIPYRFQKIEDEEIDSIKKDVKLICSEFEKEIMISDIVLIGLKKMSNGTFVKLEGKWASSIELSEYLNSAWRNKDFTATVAVFSSSSRNVQSDETKKILAVELEYEKYTGKWAAFFNFPLNKNFFTDNFELQYFERN
jgi:hypothetical protein